MGTVTDSEELNADFLSRLQAAGGIHDDQELAEAFSRLEKVWGAAIGTPEGNELEALARMIERYEEVRYPYPAPNPLRPREEKTTEAQAYRVSGIRRLRMQLQAQRPDDLQDGAELRIALA